ncbi:MAG: hypothetical protein E3J60_04500 [Dehalococcoidia bacterium]|nr:MAG: hypothetical protein E3J60_04500 [Dehalococcoidia bacterium]
MAATIVPLLTTVHDCDAVSDWTGSPTLDTEVFIQGTGSLSMKVSKTTSTHMKSIAADLSDTIIYVWILGGSIAQFDTKDNGGIRIRVEEGATPNWGEWYVAGKDEGYEGGWQCLAVRTTQAFTAQSSPAPDKTQINAVGVVFKVLASAAKINCWWDAVRYGTGLRIKGGTEAEPGTFADVVTAEETAANRWGIVIESEGVLMVQGKLRFGSTTAGESTYFKDTSKIVVFRDRPFGTFYDIVIEGNSSGTTKVFFGDKPGDAGISGCIFKPAGASKPKLTAADTNITSLGLYGCSFIDMDTVSLPAYSTSKEVLNCNFEACAEVLADTCIVKNCNFILADDRGVRIASTSHNVTYCNFISCGHCVHINLSDTISFNYLKFSGSNGTDKYDIEHSVAGTLTINCTESNPNENYVDETGGGSTNIVNTVPLTVQGVKTGEEPTNYVRCRIETDPGKVEIMNKEATISYNGYYKATKDYNYPGSLTNVIVKARYKGYLPFETKGTITDKGLTVTAVWLEDPNFT